MDPMVSSTKKIAASILSADFSRLGEEVQAVEKAGVDYIHVDVMDGHFVPNITLGPMIVRALQRATSLPLDVHLMITNPDFFLPDFIQAGSHILTVHVEATAHIHRTLMEIKKKGVRAGVSINPGTSLHLLEPLLDWIDLALVMTVNPGFGGQEFISGMMRKIEELRRMIDQRKLPIELSVDGGVNLENIGRVARAGADVLVTGSALFKAGDYQKTIRSLREQINLSP
jgi:ribulose-phosphate 3-epimerase